MKKYILLAIWSLSASTLIGQTYDPQSDTWVCDDDLGRSVASSDGGVSRSEIDEEAIVGMFYYVWHGQHGTETKDNTRLVAANPENPAFGGWGSFHWGGKPVLGYYTGGTPYIVARHMQMLVDAGIDFYFFDVTNAYIYEAQVKTVMNEIDRRTRLGLKSPKLVFTTHSSSASTVTSIYNAFYTNAANDKYWFIWNGKPLILVENGTEADLSDEVKNRFTFRYSWAWDTGALKWSWLANYPQGTGTANGKVEQISVSVAQHPSSKIGKSYHNGKQPAYDKYGLCEETPQGLYFQEQWNRALSVHPPVVMITQWNEWMAQRFEIKSQAEFGFVRPGATAKIGETYFVDVYNQEFSRDIEPSSEPLIRDNYYLQLVSNIRQYRGVHQIPVPTVSRSINIDGDFQQWADIEHVFLDEPGDVYYTSSTAQSSTERLRGSNDIVTAKVTKNTDSLYFYVATQENIRPLENSNEKVRWMTLLINADCDYSNGWYGYDLMVGDDEKQMKLFRYSDGEWKPLCDVHYTISGKEMMLAIDRNLAEMITDTDFDFKWIDNILKSTTDVLDFIAKGEAAPNGRFNYRYKGSQLLTQKFEGYYFIESAHSPWHDHTTKALLDTLSGRLEWGALQEDDASFAWRLTPNKDGTYTIRNASTGNHIGRLAQPELNGDGCGSTIVMGRAPAPLYIEMAPNSSLYIHHGSTCTQHGKTNQSFHANGHNTSTYGVAPKPDGVTAWLDDDISLSTWQLVDASDYTYKMRLQTLLSTLTRDHFTAGTQFGTWSELYVSLYQEAYDVAAATLASTSDNWYDPALLQAINNLNEAFHNVETLGYIPLSDGYYYIANAAQWDDFTTKAFHAGTNYMNSGDLIKGSIASQGDRALCIFQITYNDDEAHSYTIYSPSIGKYVGRWKSSQVSMVAESAKSPVCMQQTPDGTVLMHYASEDTYKCFYPVYYNKNSYTTTGKNYRIKSSAPLEDGLTEWNLIPTLPAEENPFVLNDTLCQLDTLLDAHPLRRYPAEAYDPVLLSNFQEVRQMAASSVEQLSGNYAQALLALQNAIDALEGRTGIEKISDDLRSTTSDNIFDLMGRPATRQSRGIVIRRGKKILNK